MRNPEQGPQFEDGQEKAGEPETGEKSREELVKEGEEIARQLGNGVSYLGPYFDIHDKFWLHFFNDDIKESGTSFTAKTFEEAKEKLIQKR